MLTLPIKTDWFTMINLDIKKEEYREVKPYYRSRLERFRKTGEVFTLRLRAGYSRLSPTMECSATVELGMGKEEWGAEKLAVYYVIKILSHKRV